MSRRFPVYILIDTSGSMQGEPIQAVKVGLTDMIASLRQNPYALETVSISIITFNSKVKQLVPLTALEDLQLPEIEVPESGATFIGAALHMLCERYDAEVHFGSHEQKGDWMPVLFLLTDGKPSDLQAYREGVERVKRHKFTNIVACAAGPKAKTEPLLLLTDQVYTLETMDITTFRKFFEWVTINIGEGGKSVGVSTGCTQLQPPPREICPVIDTK